MLPASRRPVTGRWFHKCRRIRLLEDWCVVRKAADDYHYRRVDRGRDLKSDRTAFGEEFGYDAAARARSLRQGDQVQAGLLHQLRPGVLRKGQCEPPFWQIFEG